MHGTCHSCGGSDAEVLFISSVPLEGKSIRDSSLLPRLTWLRCLIFPLHSAESHARGHYNCRDGPHFASVFHGIAHGVALSRYIKDKLVKAVAGQKDW